MSEMVERVARAMAVPEGCSDEMWQLVVNAGAHEQWLKMARAAISSMREPTEGMADPLRQMSANVSGCYDDESVARARKCWNEMIDAALKPDTEE